VTVWKKDLFEKVKTDANAIWDDVKVWHLSRRTFRRSARCPQQRLNQLLIRVYPIHADDV